MDTAERDGYLDSCRERAIDYLRALVGDGGPDARLYDSMLDYPLRGAKGLRPALCIAACRALGGGLEEAIPSAAVVELYHNAFLIHDDVEDGSLRRRDANTLHQIHGVAFALNVGDAMLALALRPLLDNMRVLDMGRALRILELVQEMALESAEGQALELGWTRDGTWRLTEADYVRMVSKKTAHYSFIAPLLVGAVVAGAPATVTPLLRKLGFEMGVAFQIRDDVLNLTADSIVHGKEPGGDLWEGKRTLIVARLLQLLDGTERDWVCGVLAKGRPDAQGHEHLSTTGGLTHAALQELLARLLADGDISQRGAQRLVDEARATSRATKSADEVRRLRELIDANGCIEHAQLVADRFAAQAQATWSELAPAFCDGPHCDFLDAMVKYVAARAC